MNDDVDVDVDVDDVPPFDISSMDANFCMPIDDVDENEGVWLPEDVIVFCCKLSGVGIVLTGWRSGSAVGTKNCGLGLGLIEADGDWNKLVGFTPPWLKVSTYLSKAYVEF